MGDQPHPSFVNDGRCLFEEAVEVVRTKVVLLKIYTLPLALVVRGGGIQAG